MPLPRARPAVDRIGEPAAVRYRIRPSDPDAHLFGIEMTIARPEPDGQILSMPAWIPGSYMIREFARHVVRIDALCGARQVSLEKIDKHTWRVGRCAGALTIRYLVYAWDLSVRGAHLDRTHGFFNGTSVFLRAHGLDHLPCEVLIDPPRGREFTAWQVATTLPSAGARCWDFGRYRAADYDELIDHPVEMGSFTTAGFEAGGARHDIAITGRHDTDFERLCSDLRAVCEAQIALFDPVGKRAPLERFLFQVMAIGDGYGGLEHRSSTALVCKRSDLPWPGMQATPEGYRSFLGLASHEYFHLWHVKRIKPARLAHHDLGQEQYTRLLWVFEGFTSYYDDLMLVRGGAIGTADYLQLLSGTVSSVLRGPGRFAQSVAESSFDAWIRYYRQDENSPNSIVSYYAKGALVALCLDLAIRAGSGGRRSLDDVMRLLWNRYGRQFYSGMRDGLAEDGLPAIVAEATGIRLDRELRDWSEGAGELPLGSLMRRVGLKLVLEPPDHAGATLGAKIALREGMLTIVQTLANGAARQAGLSSGDTIVAVDGLRMTDERSLKALLVRRKPGARVRVHAFRRDELFECVVEPLPPAATEARLSIDRGAGRSAVRMRTRWLSG